MPWTTLIALVALSLPILLVFLLLHKHTTLYRPSRQLGSQKTNILPLSPTTLSSLDISTLLAALAAKHLPGLAPALSSSSSAFTLPPLSFSGPLSIATADLATLHSALHSKPGGKASPFLLASLIFPLVPLLLAHKACPIRPLGAVNVSNTLTFANPALCRDEAALLAASAAKELTWHARLGPTGVRKKRGMQFTVWAQVLRLGEVVFELEGVYLQFLARGVEPVFRGQSESGSSEQGLAGVAQVAQTSRLALGQRDPRLWAASCRDYNPIHMSALAARAFGFKRALAHGNLVAALACESVRGAQGEAGDWLWGEARTVKKVQVEFLKPVLVPARVECVWGVKGGRAVGMDVFGEGDARERARVRMSVDVE